MDVLVTVNILLVCLFIISYLTCCVFYFPRKIYFEPNMVMLVGMYIQ